MRLRPFLDLPGSVASLPAGGPGRALIRAATVFVLLGFLAAPAQTAEPYDIYAVASLTGPVAISGKAAVETLHAAESVTNRTGGIHGRPVHFVVEDDQSNPATAVQLANAIFARHVPVFVGPTSAAPCSALYPLVAANGPVMYCFSPALRPAPQSYAFSAGISSKDIVLVALRYARARGWRRIAVLSSTDAIGQDGEAVIRQQLALPENVGLQLAADEHFNTSDGSVAAQLVRIQGANTQAVMVWANGTPFGTVLRGVNDLGLDLPLITNPGNLNSDQIRQYTAFLPKQLFFVGFRFLAYSIARPGPVHDAQQLFYETLHAQGSPTDGTTGAIWDPALIVIDALRRLPDNATAQDVHDEIERLHGYAGINGIYDFRDGSQRGVGISGATVVRWNADARTWIPLTRPDGQLQALPQRPR